VTFSLSDTLIPLLIIIIIIIINILNVDKIMLMIARTTGVQTVVMDGDSYMIVSWWKRENRKVYPPVDCRDERAERPDDVR